MIIIDLIVHIAEGPDRSLFYYRPRMCGTFLENAAEYEDC